jgi:hypothetical protein
VSKYTQKVGSTTINASGDIPEFPTNQEEYFEWWEEVRLVLNRQRDELQQGQESSVKDFDSAIVWNHTHGLGRNPLVQVLDANGAIIAPSSGVMSVEHVDINTIKVTHASAVQGKIILY